MEELGTPVDPTQIQTLNKGTEKGIRTIVEAMPSGLILVDKEGNIKICNSEVEKLFGYEPGELVGKKVELLVPRESRGRHVSYRQGYMGEPAKRKMGEGRDLTGVRKDGSRVPVEIGLNPIRMAEDVFVIATVVDITERVKIEGRLKNAYEEVQQKNEEMEQFVYTVSHDLKAPLVTSMSFLGFLKEDLQAGKSDDIQDSMERLDRALLKMQELISDLLSLSRVGRMEMNIADIELMEIVEDVLEDLEPKIDEKKVQIQIQGLLPMVRGDAKRLRQVLENLLVNALKYGTSSEAPVIQIIHRSGDKEDLICVKDNGTGIDPEYHKKIFGLFQRLDNSHEGTGVGLAIVARIVQLHGGRVWVESDIGQGAEFWIALPHSEKQEATYGA